MAKKGFMRRAMDAMRLTDDDYDDEFDLDDDFDEPAEKPAKAPKSEKKKAAKEKPAKVKKSYADDDDFGDLDDDFAEPARPAKKAPARSRITQVKSAPRSMEMEVNVIKPTEFDNASEITEALLDGVAVIINLEGLDDYLAQRIIDYTSGTCYAINGNIKQVSRYIIVVSPAAIEITGDIEDMIISNTATLGSTGKFSLNY